MKKTVINIKRYAKHIYEYLVIKKSGHFNKAFYLYTNPDVRKADIDPLWHFVTSGWKEGRNPSNEFNISDYLRLNTDVKNANINPLIHYIKFGKNEGRNFFIYASENNGLDRLIDSSFNKISPVENGYIFITHDASLTGAPIAFLHLCEAYKKYFGDNFVILSIMGGPLFDRFQELTNSINLNINYKGIPGDKNIESLFSKLYDLGYCNVVGNTIISGVFIDVLQKLGFTAVFLIHELTTSIELLGCQEIAKSLSLSDFDVVFAARYVADKFIENNGIDSEFVHIIPQGIRKSIIFNGSRKEAKKKILKKLGIEYREEIKIILGVGYADNRKGTDLFLSVIEYLYDCKKLKNIHFIWLGSRNSEFEKKKRMKKVLFPYSNHIHFLDFEKEPAFIYGASDIFLLTSREDPFPSAALEALVNNVHVIMFEDTGGIEEILNADTGTVISNLNFKEMADAILEELSNTEKESKNNYYEKFTYENYIRGIISVIEKREQQFKTNHKVSVVIPNYNYAQYLDERIGSVVNQSYKPNEIIFLDDASIDESVSKADKILSKTNIPYKIIKNKKNEGVFKQWIRGLNEAQFEYIWIAEADDVASLNFLSRVMKGFKDSEVVLSYCQSKQIDENSNVYTNFTFQDYVKDLSEKKWVHNYKENGYYEVQNYLSIKNTIPNASSVVLKKDSLRKISHDFLNFRFAGDWFAYLFALQKGKINYTPTTLNSFRRHRKSVISSISKGDIFLQEIYKIYQYIVSNFTVNYRTIEKMLENLRNEKNGEKYTINNQELFENLQAINLNRIKKTERLNILIILSEFKIGGGEITGLRLANHLSNIHNVYLFNTKGNKSDNFEKMISKNVIILNDQESVVNLIHTGKLDFINSHIWWGDKMAYKLVKDNNIFWILSMHGCYEMLMDHPEVDLGFNDLAIDILKRASVITFDAEKNLSFIKELKDDSILEKTKQIYHGYSPTHVVEEISKSTLGFTEDTFLFVFVARGIKEKGWEQAISSIQSLHNKGLNVGLVMFGDSPYVGKLEKKFKHIDYIKFLGEKHNLRDYLLVADCGILPSYFKSESQPLTIIEFLAAGLPVIASDIGEIKSMLTLENVSAGVTVSVSDVGVNEEELSMQMENLFSNKDLYNQMKMTALNIFKQKFSMDKFADAYLSVYYKKP